MWQHTTSLLDFRLPNIVCFLFANVITNRSITIFMFPAVFFFNIKLSKKFLSLILLFFLLFFSYIYGNHSINKNQLFLKSNIDKFNIKVISPNFNLEYGLTPEEIEDRLKKLIRYSEPNKDLKTLFIWPEGVFSGYNFEEIIEFKYIIEENFLSLLS